MNNRTKEIGLIVLLAVASVVVVYANYRLHVWLIERGVRQAAEKHKP